MEACARTLVTQYPSAETRAFPQALLECLAAWIPYTQTSSGYVDNVTSMPFSLLPAFLSYVINKWIVSSRFDKGQKQTFCCHA
jgi:hypothetical protein